MRTEFSHEIRIDVPVDEALPLFTPKGEEQWVPGWRPDYLAPTSGETCEEMVFRTGHGDEITLWTCLKWRPDERHARYLRVTPGAHVGFVDVRCRPEGRSATAVRVSYSYVALSPAGQAHIDAISPASFAAAIGEWAELIDGARKRAEH